MEDELIQQMGLLLTQVRVSRMSLERIEQTTATFGGLALSAASSTGPAFGAPPMIDGALKVYVINVDDFVAPAGGGFFETVLGGVGRFLGGLVGGVVGGTIGGVALAATVWKLADIAEAVARVVDTLVTTVGLTPDEWRRLLLGGPEQATAAAEPPGAMSIATSLLGDFTPPQVIQTLELLTHMVDAFIILIPIATGAAAALLQTVSSMRGEIVSFVEFLLRNLLFLRAIAVAIVTDITALITPIVTTILGAISQLIGVVFTGASFVIAETVEAAFTTARITATALTSVLNAGLAFITSNVTRLLNFVGSSTPVRLIAWFVTALPAMLTALAAAAGASLPAGQAAQLQGLSVSGQAILTSAAPTSPVPAPISATAIVTAIGPDEQAVILRELGLVTEAARMVTNDVVDEVRDTVLAAVGAVNNAVATSGNNLNQSIDTQIKGASQQLTQLENIMDRAATAAAGRTSPMIDAVADSYRSWLTYGGMDLMLGAMTEHFANSPTGSDGQTPRLLEGFTAADGRHDVVVRVDEVVIEIAAPEANLDSLDVDGPRRGLSTAELDRRAIERGGQPGDLYPIGVD